MRNSQPLRLRTTYSCAARVEDAVRTQTENSPLARGDAAFARQALTNSLATAASVFESSICV